MKPVFALLLLVNLVLNLNGQNFELSESNNNSSIPQFSLVYLIENQKDTISAFKIYTGESDIEHFIEVSELNHMESFNTKIKVEFHSTECCTNIQTYYLLIDVNKNYVKLPGIQNYQCDGPEPRIELIFPDQEFGIPNTIIKARLLFDKKFKLNHIEEISKLYFDDENFIELITIKN